MLLQYSYDAAMEVLDLLKENKIARLTVKEQDGVTAIEYRLISEFPYQTQVKAQQILSENLHDRLYLVKLWNDFVVSKSAGRDVHLDLKFNVANTEKFEFTHCLVGNLIYSHAENTEYERVQRLLESLEQTLTVMGVHGQQLVNVYRKEGTGRSKKHIPLTLGDLLFYVRKAVEE